MRGISPARPSRTFVELDEFLDEDFARIDNNTIERCMKIDGRRLYISGASGFFGKNILSLLVHLERRGAAFQVTALSRSPEHFRADQPWCRHLAWLDWQKGDVLAQWQGHGDFDYLLHAATETAADAHRDSLKLFDEIVISTRNSLNFAATHGIRRVLLCGSGAQYGAFPGSFTAGLPESTLLACDPTRPSSAYGEAKRASEMLAALHAEQHGFEVVNTRCFAFVGPGLPLNGHFAIGNFLSNALEGKPIQLATDGGAVRSYLYGADLAVWLLILLLEAENGTAINVGSDHPVRVLDLAKRVRDIVNPEVEVRLGDANSAGERHFYLPSIALAKTLGLDSWTTLDHAIARTALWYRAKSAYEARSVKQ